MKTIIFAAFAAISLGAGAAHADAGESFDWSKPRPAPSAQTGMSKHSAVSGGTDGVVIAFTDVTTSGTGAGGMQLRLMKPAQPDASNAGNPINWGSG